MMKSLVNFIQSYYKENSGIDIVTLNKNEVLNFSSNRSKADDYYSCKNDICLKANFNYPNHYIDFLNENGNLTRYTTDTCTHCDEHYISLTFYCNVKLEGNTCKTNDECLSKSYYHNSKGHSICGKTFEDGRYDSKSTGCSIFIIIVFTAIGYYGFYTCYVK
ncbi:hypothetical protein BCR32DRAFT_275504 [Anaeromyces robustus]|uniref:Uncharacterized protein n=1 Tax=Anaeromyces robustus TaxID=1754192 RepID=A0A1Y1XKI0_9FUNG|nr:hypothetical protein BCR32DRAFT_275504 [Anaeromyces robustus]|eukprot:ORX86258.1 hypothetical protein BCR32DRAFT_275504 [Anaeromyces robustus]